MVRPADRYARRLLAQDAADRSGRRLQRHPDRARRRTSRSAGWTTPSSFRESRAAYAKLVAQGWTDALRHLHPDEKIFTFWDYFRNAFARDAGIRIDHLLLSPPLADRLTAAGVDRDVRGWEKTSDHAPTWIELGRQAEAAARRRSAAGRAK